MNSPSHLNAFTRRDFLKATAASLAATSLGTGPRRLQSQETGQRPAQDEGATILNPRDRVPLSLIIDDSTCLVNLAHFCIPQFGEVFPDRYQQNWRKLPREIPDHFVRKFGQWCREKGVKGKYSIVPYPALVGWVDRELPGWTRRELTQSLDLVREFLMPDWDIHPEMVTHTWAVNTRTGRPYETRTADFMENWGFSVGLSVDQMTDYLSYALMILKNAGLTCEGVTTPGGFGSRARPQLAQGTLHACRDVFGTEIPHYFRDLYTDDRSVVPQVYDASGLESDDPRCVVSVVGCTGDWFGGWDGLSPGSADRFITADLQGGRLPEVIDRGEPACLVCHWPGIYYNGEELGFEIFKEVVRRVHSRNDNLQWMKLSEIARYWAAKELTAIERQGNSVTFHAPFASRQFTVRLADPVTRQPVVRSGKEKTTLREVKRSLDLTGGTFHRDENAITACFDLPRGASTLTM